MAENALRLLGLVRGALSLAAWSVAGLCLAGLTIVLGVAVLDRYVFMVGFAWPDAMGRMLLVWLSLSGAVVASLEARHFTLEVEMVDEEAPVSKAGFYGKVLVSSLIIVIVVWLAVYGLRVMNVLGRQTISELNISITWLYVALPLAAGGIALVETMNLIKLFMGRSRRAGGATR